MPKTDEEIRQAIGAGRPWNPYKGGFVPYNRKAAVSRLEWQRNHAAVLLAEEISKPSPRPGRVAALKRCMRLAGRWRRDFIHLLKIVTRCEMRYVPVEVAENLEKWPDEGVGLHYMGGGMIGIFDGKSRLEMRISQAAWELRRADSEIMFWVRIYGDISGIL